MSDEPIDRWGTPYSHGNNYLISATDKRTFVLTEDHVRSEDVLKVRIAALESTITRQEATITLLDTLPDAHKIAEQAKTIEQLREELKVAKNMLYSTKYLRIIQPKRI